jgi:two-component system sensor histidine kinase HydH
MYPILVEFEPVLASDLATTATQTLALTLAVAAVLTLVAVFLWRLSTRYEDARLRLEEQRRLTQLGEMSAVLAHEVRNPLASLKGAAQLLAERLPGGSRERSRADRIVHEAVRLETLTSDLLDFARTGPDQKAFADPVDVVRASIADVSPEGFTLDASTAPNRWVLDAARIRQALVNILQNAFQASPAGKPPAVRVARERNDLVIEVRDFGAGLPEGSEGRLFDPFFTTRTNGTGLGLAVASRVVEAHGGAITARNHPEGGAVFRIVLPPSAS